MAFTSSLSSSEISSLESELSSFFSASTSNAARVGLEARLSSWPTRPLIDCLSLLFGCTTEMSAMFALNALERLVATRWIVLDAHEKQLAKQVLRQSLIDPKSRSSAVLARKKMKLLADIAVNDWPHFYPDYFVFITHLVEPGSDHKLIGLQMLTIAVEQLGSNEARVGSNRRKELNVLMERQVPQLVEMTSHLLLHLLSESDAVRKASSAEIDACLQCLTQLFVFGNQNFKADMEIRAELVNALFALASVHLESSELSSSLHALDVLLELMSKRLVSPAFNSSMALIIANALGFFDKMVGVVNKGRESDNGHQMQQKTGLTLLNETFLIKAIELLRLLVSLHLHRLRDSAHDDRQHHQLLTVLFGLTFVTEANNDVFLVLLEVWTAYVDSIHNSLVNKVNLEEFGNEDYCQPMVKEALVALSHQLLKHLQFRHCHEKLHSLDQDQLDDDEVSVWQRYVRTCIELLMHVTEILPHSCLTIIYDEWRAVSSLFLSLEQHVHNGVLLLRGPSDLHQLHYLLLDLSTLVQLLGRISSLFTGGSAFGRRRQEGEELFKQIVHINAVLSKCQFYKMEGDIRLLDKHFVNLQCETMASLKAWCHWLQQLHLKSEEEELCKTLTSSALLSLTSVLHLITPTSVLENRLIHSALHFLVNLTGVVRPPCIFKLKEFTDLYNCLSIVQWNYELKTLLAKALANVLLLNWPGLKDQRWEERQRHFAKFVKEITKDFESIASVEGRDRIRSDEVFRTHAVKVVTYTSRLLSELVLSVQNENSMVKKLCNDCISHYISTAVNLLQVFITWEWEACETIFTLIRSHMDVLKNELNPSQVSHMINNVLSIFPISFVDLVLNESNSKEGQKLIESFMAILELVVSNNSFYYNKKRDKSNNCSEEYERLLEHTLSLCLDHVLPVVKKESSSLLQPLYSLLHSVLLHNQRYFIKTVSSSNKSSISRSSLVREEVLCHEARLMAIFEAIGEALTMTDVNVYKLNVEALMVLSAKWNLFRKRFFVDCLSGQFLRVLLLTLVNGSHQILRDEIVHLIFALAEVDFRFFFHKFILEFLMSTEGIDDRQREMLKNTLGAETDFPSFSANLGDFVGDLRYFRQCNEATAAIN